MQRACRHLNNCSEASQEIEKDSTALTLVTHYTCRELYSPWQCSHIRNRYRIFFLGIEERFWRLCIIMLLNKTGELDLFSIVNFFFFFFGGGGAVKKSQGFTTSVSITAHMQCLCMFSLHAA